MKKRRMNKKFIITTLMLILVISNFTLTFAFWASSILPDETQTSNTVPIGSWDFEDTEAVVLQYRTDHAYVLSLTEETVQLTDKTLVQQALSAYGLLSDEAKALLNDDYNLLLSLLNEIVALENSEFLDFEGYAYDSGLTGTVVMNGRTWYGNAVYISNDPAYDVWNDTRSLALRTNAYFESRTPFINGIDKITLYHGALNFDNGASFGFRIEYELQSNPGTWIILQEGGVDLIVDVISDNPLSFSEINVNITQSIDIRFVPVISNTSDYINLDDIRIYENVVESELEVDTFRTVYAAPLALTVSTVTISNKSSVLAALSAYDLLSFDAQNTLTLEKALLDDLLIEIELQEDYQAALNAVILAESSNLQIHVDAAQILIDLLPSGTNKTLLQNRLNTVQLIIDDVETFLINQADVLALTLGTVELSDKDAVEDAISAYNQLSSGARAELASEKAHLDALLAEINNMVPTETLILEFLNNHATALSLTTQTVQITDLLIITQALDAYNVLTPAAKAELLSEKALLDSLLIKINILEATELVIVAETTNMQIDVDAAQILVSALPSGFDKNTLQLRLDDVQGIIDSVNFFIKDYATVLALTEETVTPADKIAIEEALSAYGLLSNGAKDLLITEKDLLLSLLSVIIAFENSEFLDFEGYAYDSGLTGTVVMNGRTWYGSGVYISNDPNYDVWNDTRSLALRTSAYFESRTPFINGIDKITLYHGALNFDNGASFGFRIEYELQSNPGTWIILQEGGVDLIVDVISDNPLSFSEINVNITQSIDIRFVPVISNTSDYINLDDIRIYENVVESELEVSTYQSLYANVLALTTNNVNLSHQDAVTSALSAYDLLSVTAQNALTTEKALLDDLLIEIELQQDYADALFAVEKVESTFIQADLDDAQMLVNALPSGTEKTALQDRINNAQLVITEVDTFRFNYSDTLSLTIGTVLVTDKADVEDAISNYLSLGATARSILTFEKALLDSLLAEINSQTPTEDQVLAYLNAHAAALALTVPTVTISDELIITQALNAYELLTPEAKAELLTEKALLDSLITQIDILVATEAVVLAETTNLQIDHDAALIIVNDLPASSEKTSLLSRLSAVQDIIDQIAAETVIDIINLLPSIGAIELTDEIAIVDARSAYYALSTNQQALVTNLSMLVLAENQWLALDTATDAVILAESTPTQGNHDAAQALIILLADGTPKQALQTRIDAVQDTIDVNTAQSVILNYFASNPVVVTNLNNNTIKQNAFLAKANEIVASYTVSITVNSFVRISRTNSTYNITVSKNAASVTFTVSVTFER